MQFLYKDNLLDMLGFVKHQIEFIEESTKDVSAVNDLLVTMTGIVLYNSTLMCLQTIGETLKNVDNLTDPYDNSINEKCARIRMAFVSSFSDELAGYKRIAYTHVYMGNVRIFGSGKKICP